MLNVSKFAPKLVTEKVESSNQCKVHFKGILCSCNLFFFLHPIENFFNDVHRKPKTSGGPSGSPSLSDLPVHSVDFYLKQEEVKSFDSSSVVFGFLCAKTKIKNKSEKALVSTLFPY